MASAHGILIEIVGDASSYLRSAESTLATNTKLDASFRQVGVNANLSADAQIKAALKAQEALKANALALSSRAAALPGGSREQAAATLLAAEAQTKYARSVGITTAGTVGLSRASSTAERDLNKSIRGALSGSGAFRALGRSLAFASSGFLAAAIGADAIAKSITAAEGLAKAQESLSVAIAHTGGNSRTLLPIYTALAKAAAQFGVSEVEATTGLAKATVLTGNADAALRAYQEAVVISKALGKDFNQVLIATSKAQEGLTTSLRRYLPIIGTGASGTEQFAAVMKRFGGQAEANTTASDKFRASVANFEATLGTALLPTFDRLTTRLSAWLAKMEKSGKLQKDVNGIVHTAGRVFHDLGRILGVVDKLTGSFANTLKILIGLKFASVLVGWVSGLGRLATAWKGVAIASGEAAGAESLAGGAAARSLPLINTYAAALVGAYIVGKELARLGNRLTPYNAKTDFQGPPPDVQRLFDQQNADQKARRDARSSQQQKLLDYERNAQKAGIFGGPGAPSYKTPLTEFKTSFSLTYHEQAIQAQAQLTKATADDVAAAKQVIARIKRLLTQGRLHGKALLDALGLEASAMSTIWSAEDAAAQARAAAAQKQAAAAQAAKDKIAAQIQDSIDPLRLEVALSRAQALGKPLTRILRELRASAEKALKSGKLSLEQQKEAYDQITSINQQLSSSATSSSSALGGFKQLNIDKIAKSLHLSVEDAKRLKAQLSQIGPGRTVPGSGVGAYGYALAGSGRVEHHHHHLYIDGKPVEASVRNHRRKRHNRNSSQRRGPNAGWDD